MINKTDLSVGLIKGNEKIASLHKPTISCSVVEEKGIEELYNAILELFKINDLDVEETDIVTSNRQKGYIIKALEATEKAHEALDAKMPIDIVAITLTEILEQVSYITGENVSEDVINEIFKKFCLGK